METSSKKSYDETDSFAKAVSKDLGLEVLAKVGEGGYSNVYLMKKTNFPAFYYVKINKDVDREGLEYNTRISVYQRALSLQESAEREFSMMAMLSHPRIAKPSDIKIFDGLPVIIFPATIDYQDYEIALKKDLDAWQPGTLEEKIKDLSWHKEKFEHLVKLMAKRELYRTVNNPALNRKAEKCTDEIMDFLQNIYHPFYKDLDSAKKTYFKQEATDLEELSRVFNFCDEIDRDDVEDVETNGVDFIAYNVLKEMKKLFISLYEGIEYLHQQDISHQDIKKNNILVTKNGCLIIDFNIARILKNPFDTKEDEDEEDEDEKEDYDERDIYSEIEKAEDEASLSGENNPDNHDPENLWRQQKNMPSTASHLYGCPFSELHDLWGYALVLHEIIFGEHIFNKYSEIEKRMRIETAIKDLKLDDLNERRKFIKNKFIFNFEKHFKSKHGMTRKEILDYLNYKATRFDYESNFFDEMDKQFDKFDFFDLIHLYIKPIKSIPQLFSGIPTTTISSDAQKIFSDADIFSELILKCFNVDNYLPEHTFVEGELEEDIQLWKNNKAFTHSMSLKFLKLHHKITFLQDTGFFLNYDAYHSEENKKKFFRERLIENNAKKIIKDFGEDNISSSDDLESPMEIDDDLPF